MLDVKAAIKAAIIKALPPGVSAEVIIQETPSDKPGDFATPVAFALARELKQNPAEIARAIQAKLELPPGVSRVETIGPYINFFLEPSLFIAQVALENFEMPQSAAKVVIEHSSVNPNKEWHVGHIRGALIGDAMGRLYRRAGFEVEIQNYIDDTGRQAAESLFAAERYYGKDWLAAFKKESQAQSPAQAHSPVQAQGNSTEDEPRPFKNKFDHWLGQLYVRLHIELENPTLKAELEPQILNVIHELEEGKHREVIERIVRAHLQTAQSIGLEYDLLVWESDIVREGFVDQALSLLLNNPLLVRPSEGKFAGTVCIDLSPFVPGLEEPLTVLVRSNGTTMYACKDIAFHYWKFGLFQGLKYTLFAAQPSGKPLYSSHPAGTAQDSDGNTTDKGRRFAQADIVINPIDTRQTLAQIIVKAGLSLSGLGKEAAERHIHLAMETVLLEGKAMSGRKGITVSADEVIAEAQRRAGAVVGEKNPELTNALEVARIVGVGALKFAFLKAEPKNQIDFRWDAALALVGDTAPVAQYAHARARAIERKAQSLELGEPNWSLIGALELELAKVIARFPEVLATCLREHSPHPMATHALELASAWNAYYNHKGSDGKSDTSVLSAPAGLREARLMLVKRVADAIKEALGLLGIEAPEEM